MNMEIAILNILKALNFIFQQHPMEIEEATKDQKKKENIYLITHLNIIT